MPKAELLLQACTGHATWIFKTNKETRCPCPPNRHSVPT